MQYTARIVVKPDDLADLTMPTLPKEYWPDYTQKDRSQCNLKRLAWYETEEGKEYKRKDERNTKALKNLRFSVLLEDGTFRFDDLPAGEYAMVISESDNCGLGFELGRWYLLTTFIVESTEEPLELGELNLEPIKL